MQARQTQGQVQGLSQNLTMTPQLVQSIKLLQMSSFELMKHVEEEVEKNPLLEILEPQENTGREPASEPARDNSESIDTVGETLETSQSSMEEALGTSLENSFDTDRSGGEQTALQHTGASSDFGIAAPDSYNLEEFVAEKKSLRVHLMEQLALSRVDRRKRAAAGEIIENLDEDGFFRQDLGDLPSEQNYTHAELEQALSLVQGFDPVGIAARSLNECLAIQLREKNRFDPAMECLVNHLELLAKKDFDTLEELCGVSLDDLLDMVDEIKALEPRPARAFDTTPVQNIVPDIFVLEKPDGSFAIELNPDTLPKVLVNQTYQAIVSTRRQNPETKAFITDCLQSANWLIRSLEQRANTILKVMAEIVRHQDGFFAFGISHLKPLSLKQVADEIKMHESTVSRVTSNKYVLTNRGIYELKFFFTTSINGTQGEDAHSSEAVRQRIRQAD